MEVRAALLKSGWRVFVIWECATEIEAPEKLIRKVVSWLESNKLNGMIPASRRLSKRTGFQL
jgi:G:T-mismatch repair DNA endonuclease (very short patch repair protein)